MKWAETTNGPSSEGETGPHCEETMPPTYESAREAPHFITRSGSLRAAVLGANDGIVSVSSLIVGVAAADPSPGAVLLAAGAGLAAGAMSMAAGEYVSVRSQSDIERAAIARETEALAKTGNGLLRQSISPHGFVM